MYDRKQVAKNVRILRVINDYTQVELAKRANVSECTIVSIEKAKGKPRISTLKKIAKALYVEAQDLLK